MRDPRFRWLNGDITVESFTFCHSGNGDQEFFEVGIAAKSIMLGMVRNHPEQTWEAYAVRGETVRTLNSATQRADGKLDAEPLYDTPNDPQSLAEALVRLWHEHGERILALPCKTITEEG